MVYNNNINFREKSKFYIPLKDKEIQKMLEFLKLKNLDELYKTYPQKIYL